MNQEQKNAMALLKTAKGQVEGIIKMLEDDRYCVDISNQILAVNGLLNKANSKILRQHMNHCMKEAFLKGNGEQKVDEVMMILDKFTK
ncbi:MAG: metal-sensing transcriptional repressor [Clostridia bacterium]|nr:metal-sensing transcriptional repressor [Clostridia bacterium]